jgi:rubredoxin
MKKTTKKVQEVKMKKVNTITKKDAIKNDVIVQQTNPNWDKEWENLVTAKERCVHIKECQKNGKCMVCGLPYDGELPDSQDTIDRIKRFDSAKKDWEDAVRPINYWKHTGLPVMFFSKLSYVLFFLAVGMIIGSLIK